MSENTQFWDSLTRAEQDDIQEIVARAEEARRFLANSLFSAKLTKSASPQLRAKTKYSIARKLVMSRTRYGGSAALDDLTDYVGLRLVVNFESQLEDICKQIEKNFCPEAAPIKDGPFVMRSLNQVLIYKPSIVGSDDAAQDIYRHLEGVGRRKGFSVRLETKPGLYSGIHFLGRVYCGESPESGGHRREIACEIQARTVFEHAWAEIAHKIYEMDRELNPGEADDALVGTRTRQHLLVLKNMLDTASRYTDLIKRQVYEDLDDDKINNTAAKPDLSSVEEIQGLLSSHDIPKADRDAFMLLFHQKDEIDKLKKIERELPENSRKYLNLANKFQELRERSVQAGFLSVAEKCEYSEAQRLFFYYLHLEEPLCRLLTNSDEQVRLARNGYLDLETDFPESATLKFRLGQSYQQLGRFDEAIDKYHQAYTLMRQLRAVPERQRQMSLTPCQASYFEDHLARMLSFAHWMRARRLLQHPDFDRREVCSGFLAAYRCAIEGLEDWQNQSPEAVSARKRLLNSGIYFGAEVLLHDPAKKPELAETYGKLVADFELLVDPDNPEDLKCLDTLSYALFVLGDTKRAKELAKRILRILATSDQVGNYLAGEKVYTFEEQRGLIMDRANKLALDVPLVPQFRLTN